MIKIDKKVVQDFWDNEANKIGVDVHNHHQSGMIQSNWFLATFRKNIEEFNFNKLVDMDKINTVLELGCGSGRWSSYLSDKAESITAVDFSENMIDLAINYQNSSNSDRNINYIQCEAQNFLIDAKFDLIYLSGVSPYLNDADMKKMMKNVKKMSHNQTILFARDSLSILDDTFHKNGEYPVIYRKIEEYQKIFMAEGFTMQYQMRSFINPYLSDKFKLDKILGMSIVMLIEKAIGQKIALHKENFDIKYRNKIRRISHDFHLYQLNK